MNRYWVLSLIAYFPSLLLLNSVHAEVRTDEKIVVAPDEIVDDDLYVFAQHVVIDGTIKGDLIAFAETVIVNGVVEGDFLGAARAVTIEGQVNDDVRVAGQTITLGSASSIEDDLVTAGQSLNCKSNSHIGGEVQYAGYQATFAGTVDRELKAATANCELAGQFGSNVSLTAAGSDEVPQPWIDGQPIPAVARGLTISETATIAGDLEYKSTVEAIVDPAASIAGTVQFEQLESDATGSPVTVADQALSALKYFFALLVVGLLVVFAFPGWTRSVTTNIQTRPLASFGWGLGSVVAVIAGAVLILAAIIVVAILLGQVSLERLLPAWLGIGLLTTAAISVTFAAFATWVSKVFVGFWAGKALLHSGNDGSARKFFALALGLALFVGISLIPVVGSIFATLVSLLGVGATAIWALSLRKSNIEGAPLLPMKQAA